MTSTTENAPIFVYLESETVVAGQNYENADPGNPNGYYYSERWMAAVQLNDGEVFRHYHLWADKEVASKFVAKVRLACAKGQDLNMKHWRYHRLAYGSKAFRERGGEEELIALERAEMVEELGHY